MSRTAVLAVFVVLLLVIVPVSIVAAQAERVRRPNVVLIITDDQGYGDLACHGNPIIQTPHMDQLHGDSVRLTNFHVDPTCAPTRSALMTGRYSGRVGVWHTIMGRSLLRADEVTMADVFQAGGYRTGIFGKWHLGDNYPFRPQDRGFQKVVIHGGGGVGQTPDHWGNDYFDDTYRDDGTWEPRQGYCTDVWFDEALAFIEANRDEPFFCYLTTNAPHGPYHVADKYRALYQDSSGVPNPNFYGMITNADENLGRLRKRLADLNLEDNTLLIFMTDNGTAAGFRKGQGFNAGMRGTKGSEFDGGHRVPCFLYWPRGGIGGGRDVTQLTAHVDLLPSLAQWCGLNVPDKVRFDGQSLVSLIGGDVDAWPGRTLFVESQRIDHPEKWRKSAVMTDRWRLINGQQLFDMLQDPGQQHNVAMQYPDTAAQLRVQYDQWWSDVSRRHDEYCEIVLGTVHENPAHLTCHDWHGAEVPWNQTHVNGGTPGQGFWAVQFDRAGEYRFSLRRWPVEVQQGIRTAVPGGKSLALNRARLRVGDFEQELDIPEDAQQVNFTARMPQGSARLVAEFLDQAGRASGAYYVSVERLP
jgi:arylsulfatase A-like enzyme